MEQYACFSNQTMPMVISTDINSTFLSLTLNPLFDIDLSLWIFFYDSTCNFLFPYFILWESVVITNLCESVFMLFFLFTTTCLNAMVIF